MNYVGFVPRLGAFLIDAVILIVVQSILTPLLGGADSALASNVSTVISIAYAVIFVSQYQATPGKMVLKIKVVDEAGNKPTMVNVVLRETVGKFVSAIILLGGYFMVLWDPKKQGLHDKIAKTYVVKQ